MTRKTLACLAGLALLGLVATPAAAQKVTLKIATLVPQGSAWHTTLQEMVQAWQQASNGTLTVRLYPGGVAGDDGDVIRKMRLGTLDGGLISISGLTNIDRAASVLSVPMLVSTYEEYDYVAARITPELSKIYDAKGFVVLGWADGGLVRLFTKQPVRTPEDLRKEKIFSWAGDGPTIELWKASGFNPVGLPSTEISTALQTGLITAIPTTPQAAILLQWYNHAKFMTDVNWGVLVGALVLNKASWEKIPADLRPALAAAAEKAAKKLTEQTRTGLEADVKAMAARGLTVVHVDAAGVEAWRKVAELAYPKARGTYAPAELFDRVRALRDEVRKQGGK